MTYYSGDLYPGDDRLIIMTHGFMGTPYSFHFMIRYFQKQGYSVWTPLLMGHGAEVKQFEQNLPFEWYDDFKYQVIQFLNKHPFRECHLIGLSMGGAFSLRLSIDLQNMGILTNTLTLLATPYRLKFHQQLMMTIGYEFCDRFYPYKRKKASDIRQPLQREINTRYAIVPMRTVFGLSYFLRENQSFIKQVSVPTLVVHSRQDHTIPYRQGRHIYHRLGIKQKRFVSLKQSFHILPLDLEREIVFQEVDFFLKKEHME